MAANPIKIILWLGHRRLTSLATECSPDLPLSKSWKISAQYAASWIYVSCATHANAYDVMMSLLSWSPDCLHSKLPVVCHDSWVPLWSGFCVFSPFARTCQLGSYHSELSTDSWKEACIFLVLRSPLSSGTEVLCLGFPSCIFQLADSCELLRFGYCLRPFLPFPLLRIPSLPES